jgi:hypothetical protein
VVIIRGDSYAIRRPLFTHVLRDDQGALFPLTGCTVRTTFREAPVAIATDPTDAQAAIKGTLVVSEAGAATSQDKLYLVGAAANGTVQLRLTAAETAALTPGVAWQSDVQVTDAAGEVFTWTFTDTLKAVDAFTHRSTG